MKTTAAKQEYEKFLTEWRKQRAAKKQPVVAPVVEVPKKVVPTKVAATKVAAPAKVDAKKIAKK